MPAFFGRHEIGQDGMPTERWERSQLTSIQFPYPMRLAWDLGAVVTRTRCHNAVARDLNAIIGEIWLHYGRDVSAVRAARMDLFGGCFNYRRMRGGSSLSMHAWGIAIDLDPDRNALGVAWKPKSGMMPEAVIDIFAGHGWTWGGLFSRPDAMHFQATKRG